VSSVIKELTALDAARLDAAEWAFLYEQHMQSHDPGVYLDHEDRARYCAVLARLNPEHPVPLWCRGNRHFVTAHNGNLITASDARHREPWTCPTCIE
jgi:hypothetical protein